MFKAIFAIAGLILLALSVHLFVHTNSVSSEGTAEALQLDNTQIVMPSSFSDLKLLTYQNASAILDETEQTQIEQLSQRGKPPLSPIVSWKSTVANRVMSEGDSQDLRVDFSNNENKEVESEVIVHFNSDEFIINPEGKTRKVKVPPSGTASVAWIIKPQKLGMFTILIEGPFKQESIGIKVKNVYGLSLQTSKILAYLGTIFGSLITSPFLIQLWNKYIIKKTDA